MVGLEQQTVRRASAELLCATAGQRAISWVFRGDHILSLAGRVAHSNRARAMSLVVYASGCPLQVPCVFVGGGTQ